MIAPASFEVRTRERNDWIDISAKLRCIVADSGVREGICVVFVPHTTAAVTVNENADPDVPRDLRLAMDGAAPDRSDFRHGEGNSAAHAKTSLVGPSLTLIVSGGDLVLGTWQAVWFTEFDGPRTRKVFVKLIEG